MQVVSKCIQKVLLLVLLTALPAFAQNARIQFVHSSGDIDGRSVDVYVADTLYIDNFGFQSATAFMDVPSGAFNVKISPDDQAPADSLILEADLTLDSGGRYIAVVSGILPINDGKYTNPDPANRNITFNVYPISNAQETAQDPTKTDVMVFQGSTDTPVFDFVTGDGAVWADDLDYGVNTAYASVDAGNYTLQITDPGDNTDVWAKFNVDVLPDSVVVMFTTGFLTPEDDQGSQALALIGVSPSGNVVEFERIIELIPGPWKNAGTSSYQYDSVFEDTTVVSPHGVAVDKHNRVWSGSYGASEGIRVRSADGTEALFSPIASVTIDGTEIDFTANANCRGMAVAKDGNILYAKGATLVKINVETGEGMAKWDGGGSLGNPSVDDQGFIYAGLVVGVNPVSVLNGETLALEQEITLPGAPSFTRGTLVSADGTTLWSGDLGGSGGPLYKWTSEDFVNYTITDSIFANTDAEPIFTTQRTTMNGGPNGTMWVSHDNAYAAGDNSPNGLFAFDFNSMEYTFLPMPDDIPGTGNGPRNATFSVTGDTAYVASFNAGRIWKFVRETPTRIQFVHASADIDGRSVDVYVNDELKLDNFSTTTATPFMDIDAGAVNIKISPDDQLPADSLIVEADLTLDAGGTYVAMVSGILPINIDKYNNPDPGNRDISFNVYPISNAQEAAQDPAKVDFLVFHGSTDAPAVDVIARGVGTLVDDADYGQSTSYISVDPASYTLDITPAQDNNTIAATFEADLSGLAGGAAVVFASGFLTPADNQGGQALGLFAALPNGVVVEFERIIELIPGPWKNAGTSSYQYDSVFEDTTVVSPHGVAVDKHNRVWSGSYGASEGIRVRSADGTEALFSPIASVTIDGTEIDFTANANCRGMAVAKDGNILYAKGATLVKINVETGEGMAKWDGGGSLGNPSVDDQGFIYAGLVVGVNPVSVLNGETLALEQEITLPGAPSFTRGTLVSADGTTLWSGDLGGSGGPLYKWTSEDFVNYTITDSIFANTDAEPIFTTQRTTMNGGPNGTMWVSHDNAYAAGDNSPNGLFAFDFNSMEYTFLPMPDDIPGTGNGPRNATFSVTGDTAYVASFNAGRIWRFTRTGTGIGDKISAIPDEFALKQNYPNPFNPSTVIAFDLDEPGQVELKIFNSIGREVATLVNNRMTAGRHEVTFNASGLASGVYYYRIAFNKKIAQRKMLLVK